nr:MAG TPA: hypothetical protein [Herelleviridae sp.]
MVSFEAVTFVFRFFLFVFLLGKSKSFYLYYEQYILKILT